jgi:penicillin-binding protein 2
MEPTGSVFKLTTLAAALENGVSPSRVIVCNGTFQVPGQPTPLNDDKVGGHGPLTPVGAIPPSCDVVFWTLAVEMNTKDPNILPTMARAFGYGSPTGIVGVPDGVEAAGQVPDPAYYQKQGSGWAPVNAANLAIGQDAFLATPAQVAMVAAALGNNGTRMQPRLVSSVETVSGTVVTSYPAKKLGTLPISAEHIGEIQMAMLGVTTQPGATTYAEFAGANYPILVAGKTGTAESGNGNPSHGWFSAYAPASPLSGPAVTPQLAAGFLVAYVGVTAEFSAVPAVKSVFSAFFNVK